MYTDKIEFKKQTTELTCIDVFSKRSAHVHIVADKNRKNFVCTHYFLMFYFTSLRFALCMVASRFALPCVLCILSIRSISLWLHGMHRSERKHDWVCQLWMSLMLEAAGIFNSILLLDVSAFRCGWMCMRLISSIVWLFLYLFFPLSVARFVICFAVSIIFFRHVNTLTRTHNHNHSQIASTKVLWKKTDLLTTSLLCMSMCVCVFAFLHSANHS